MAGMLCTTLTGSMESIHVEDGCTELHCDDMDTPQASTAASSCQPITQEDSGDDVGGLPIKNTDRNPSRAVQPMPDIDSKHITAEHPEREERHSDSENDSSLPNIPVNVSSQSNARSHVSTNQRSPGVPETDASASNSNTDTSSVSPPTNMAAGKRKAGDMAGGEGVVGNGHAEGARQCDRAGEGTVDGAAANPRAQYFVKDWEFVQTLGEGAYGEVKLAYNVKTQEAVAVKIINTKGENKAAMDDVRKEVCIHRMISHKNIIKFYGVRKDGDTQYLFLQYASGGELFDRIEPDVGMPQTEAQNFFRQLIDGLEYLHSKGITHRDIKPENLLLDEHDTLKIADFGLATVFRHQGKWRYLDRLCGSAPYLAPEVISSKPYRAEPADIWASGIVLVAMLGGELPWDAAVLGCVDYVNWRECHIENRPWSKIDNLALCLLRRLLVDKPDKRYTVDSIRKNQWFTKDFTADAAHQLSAGPKRRRARGSESDQSPGAVSCSQPTISTVAKDTGSSGSYRDEGSGAAVAAADNAPISFSQPVQAENMLLSSQLSATQSSQTPMQKLVRRMTRFFSKLPRADVMEQLSRVFSLLGYRWNHTSANVLTVHTLDRRQSTLTFKVTILEMGESLLFDFRLSKGDGLEFKRQFIRIHDNMKSVICKVPCSWPNLPNF